MKNTLVLCIVMLGLLSAAGPALAHHSTAMYDMANPVTVTGTVKRFEWTNPHAFIFIDVKDDKGNSVEWEIELMSLNHLGRTDGCATRSRRAIRFPARAAAPRAARRR